MLDKWHKKEKPVFTGIARGVGGFAFGGAAGGGSSTPTGMVATGGQISDYPDGSGNLYRAHIFTTSGSLVVTDLGEIESTVDILSVGGCLLYTSPSPRDRQKSRMPSSA